MRRALLALLLISLAGPALAAQPAKGKPDGRKSVCVVSAIGEAFQLKKIGIMVFGNEEKSVPIRDWKIDQRVSATAARLLQKNFQVRRSALPASGYKSMYEGSGRDYRDAIGDSLRKIAGNPPCDFYLLVVPGGSQVGSSNQFVAGLGVVQHAGITGYFRRLYALSTILVYDGKSFSLLREDRLLAMESFLSVIHGRTRTSACRTRTISSR